ncbi:hypothetical protein LBMAG48_14350 [Phycisphaerae bacterium]|nr:hypothetical protein LBMAG48_14350 [Phycisphaerae bacterium]
MVAQVTMATRRLRCSGSAGETVGVGGSDATDMEGISGVWWAELSEKRLEQGESCEED